MDKHEFYKQLGIVIKRARVRKGLTVYGLHQATNQNMNTLYRIEEGKAFQVLNLIWIKECLGISIDDAIEQAMAQARRVKRDGKNRKEWEDLI